MIPEYDQHNLSLVPEKYRKAVTVLLEYEDSLTDGYDFYCEFVASEQAEADYEGDYVLSALVELVKEIEGALL